jgi:hypothetical protein
MPAPTPYIFVHCDTATLNITRLGLLTETGGQPIMLNSCTARASLSTDRLEDFWGDLYAQAWGNRKLVYDLSMDQFAQYGISDSYLGRIDPTLLANLAVNFGMSAVSSGTALLTQASRELIPAKIAKVNLTIEVEDERKAGRGSPDGPSTPSWISGTAPAGTRPAITSSLTPTGTIGTAFSYTLTATGTATITFALAPGQVLPPGLALAGAVISGTPTGSAAEYWTEVRASNAYGTSFALLHFTIAAAAVAPPLPVQTYVRYLVDSGQATVPDGFWARSYSGMSPEPTNQTTFLAGTPGSSVAMSTDPGTPTNPNALTGTIGGTRAWQITEIYGRDPGTGVYSYWYQRTPATDTVLAAAVTRGVDILDDATEEFVVGEDIGTVGPGDPTPPAWPGTIKPSSRIEQYYVWKDFLNNKTYGAGLGGDKTYPDLPSFLAAHPSIYLNYTETQTTVLLEYYQKSGTPGYIHQRTTSDTRIATALGSTLSPIYNGVDNPGGFNTSLPEVAPSFTLLPLPAPPATSTGPAPDPLTWLYVLERSFNGARQCWGLHAYPPTSLTLHRLLGVYGKITSRANHDECTYGMPWVEEVWMRFASVSAGAWQCYWLDGTLYPSTASAPIGLSLADNVTPVNNPLVAPGLVYSDSTIQW